VKHRLHGAVLGKDAVPGRPVPIYLDVKVIAIQFLCSRLGIVVGVGCSGSRDGIRARIFAAMGSIAGSLLPAYCLRPVPFGAPVAGEKIIPTRSCWAALLVSVTKTGALLLLAHVVANDVPSVQTLVAEYATEISGANGGSRQCDQPGIAIVAFVGAVVASKEEQLVLLDGATESAAKIIELTVSLWASLKELLCTQSLVSESTQKQLRGTDWCLTW